MNRNTHQKQSVLTAVQSMRGQHPTADAVYEEVLRSLPTISRATVFRILNQYADQGVLSRVHVPGSPTRYDDLTERHHHLLCSSCQRLFDLPGVEIKEPALPKDTAEGCRITGMEVIFHGVCFECESGASLNQ